MTKRNRIIYWIATVWLALGMLSTGIVQLSMAKDEVDLITQLGYPVYILTIIGVWKVLGVVAVLIPRFPLLKEWAYAGFFFVATGGILSHLATGNSMGKIFPLILLLVLTVVSWHFRPDDRKLIRARA
jgi:uncharacterized membrane protein YphA (DoxX/SURF4 family)